jgi:hypothetical protein
MVTRPGKGSNATTDVVGRRTFQAPRKCTLLSIAFEHIKGDDGEHTMLLLILLIVLIFGFGYGGYRIGPGYGYYGGGGISLILTIILILLLLKVI